MTWLAALGIDLLFGDPPNRFHPVFHLGRLIAALRDRAPRGERARLVWGALIVGAPAALALAAGAFIARLPPIPRTVIGTTALGSSFALRALLSAGGDVERALARGDLPAARAGLRALVSRPVDALDETQLASAAIESLTENLADSYIAPLAMYAAGGLPLAFAYRAVNTADAMVGYRGALEHLGKASARLDDLANLAPSRLAALAIAAAAPLVGGSPRDAIRVLRRDHARTASPNAGWPMSAAAGALGVRVEKVGEYALGNGRAPTHRDIGTARALVLVAALLATLAAMPLLGRRD